MQQNLIASVLACASIVPGASLAASAPDGYQLEEVLLMSRHNLRAPLADNGSVLAQSTSKPWPTWNVPGGQLTTKGGVLEVYMGHYLHDWLAEQGLVKRGVCPTPDSVYVYANSLQRTVATAQFFTAGAFPGCDIPIHHQEKMGTMDPTFTPAITNGSEAFKTQAIKAMEAQRQHYSLKESYDLLATIADYQHSPACESQGQCDLTASKDTFRANLSQEPGVSGPLSVGNSLVDAFTLQYYEGFPLDQVAWGQITTDKQWQLLSQLKNSYQDTLFTSPYVARNVAAPLIHTIKQTLVDNAGNGRKVTLLVGHDSNIASLLTALDVKPYQLPGQYERTPIGGKVLFQRWHDTKQNRDLLKVEYVYQSREQLRNTDKLTLENPPQRLTLQLTGCPTDDNGFCDWNTFSRIVSKATK